MAFFKNFIGSLSVKRPSAPPAIAFRNAQELLACAENKEAIAKIIQTFEFDTTTPRLHRFTTASAISRALIEIAAGIEHINQAYGTQPEKLILQKTGWNDAFVIYRQEDKAVLIDPEVLDWCGFHHFTLEEYYEPVLKGETRGLGVFPGATQWAIRAGMQAAYYHLETTKGNPPTTVRDAALQLFDECELSPYKKAAEIFCTRELEEHFGLHDRHCDIQPGYKADQRYEEIPPAEWHLLRAAKQSEQG